jgi:hypothetical protein
MILSALLGALGSVSVMAQTNVYSLNAVGYINVTLLPGFNQVTCPLITSPDNTVGTVLNNSNGALTGSQVYFYTPSGGYDVPDTAKAIGGKFGTTNANGWAFDGTNVASPGVGFWFDNTGTSNLVVTFVGTVPTGPITNSLVPGFNLVGSVVPVSGDIITNSLSLLTNYNIGDQVYTYNPALPPASAYTIYSTATGKFAGYGYDGNWTTNGDPIIPAVGQGFWYDNKSASTIVNWVENYSVSQ